MGKLTGWLLDVYPNYELNYMTSWLKLDNGTRVSTEQLSEPFEPRFYVHGSKARLNELVKKLRTYPEIKRLEFRERRIKIDDLQLYEVLEVTMRDYRELKPFAAMIDREGKYAEFQLYNVDLRLSQKYMLNRKVFPLAHVAVDSTLSILDAEQFALEYPVPELIEVGLDIKVNKRGRIVTYNDPVGEITLDDRILTNQSEPELLQGLVEAVAEVDPDIIYTTGGDSFVMPYLYHRAEVNDMTEAFQLGREHEFVYSDHVPGVNRRPVHGPRKAGKSYFTYGQIKYKPPFYSLKGRIHIDKLSSFIFLESGLFGLIELARLAGIPLQTMSRLSPGTAISSMQVSQAMHDGVLVRWKKNVPETFKNAKTLLLADRGGHTFNPLVGVHENVLEIDFASLYPNIIAKKNISPETVLCECCANDAHAPRVPATDYHVCRKRRGLIPRVIERVIQRRVVHKERMREENDIFDQRQKVLKWVLVTCFGYTGYRNARFGRIECHESITAYGREILLDAKEVAEESGYNVLHGIVDSLWVTADDADFKVDTESLCEAYSKLCGAIATRTGIDIEFEGFYRWIVFLPNKSTGVGALTRYYGLLDSGKFKVRGIELRQRSTPKYFMSFQEDLLDTLATATTKKELIQTVNGKCLDVLRSYARTLLHGECDIHELVFSTRVTRTLGEYRVFNDRVAALTQLVREGVEVHPGETVRYVVLNHSSRDPQRRVRVLELIEGDEQYDRQKYLKYLLRVADSLLRPFGYTEDTLQEELEKSVQITII
jgi:DNA polymerase elongation subunit (family B)